MSPRASLPGADELFRATSGAGVAELDSMPNAAVRAHGEPTDPAVATLPEGAPGGVRARPRRGPDDRAPSGRQRHEEKITVYVSGTELVDLERARLVLRAEHGLAVDRGRIVREALAVVLADLEAKSGDSILVRRLRGR